MAAGSHHYEALMADKDPPTKEICHWTKSQLETHFELLSKIVAEPNFACTK